MKKSCFMCSLMIGVSLLFTACQKSGDGLDNGYHVTSESIHSDAGGEREWAYVPEVAVIEDADADYENMQPVGGRLCALTMGREEGDGLRYICQYDVDGRELAKAPVQYQAEGDICEIGHYAFGQDFVWLTANVYASDYSQLRRFLCKFDMEGKNLVSEEITEQIGHEASIEDLAVDEQGRIYIFTGDAGGYLYTGDGSFYGSVPYNVSGNVRIKGASKGNDGKFYICMSREESPDSSCLMEIDFEGKRLTEVTGSLSNIRGFCAAAQPEGESGKQYDFLFYDNVAVYGYDFAAQEGDTGSAGEELFCWLDGDINGYCVANLYLLEDGRLCAMVADWENDDRAVVALKRVKAGEAPRRENLVLATVDGDSGLTAMAVKFNRGSSRYHLAVKSYESLTDLYNDVLRKEPMDLVDLSGINAQSLASQGFFEDLTPYLERAENFSRSDFVDGILNVYTYDNILAGIPAAFTLRTVAGNRAQLSNKEGLSLEELLSDAGRQQGVKTFDGVTRDEMMQYIMLFNEDTFIDRKAGTCQFDSEIFREVLEYVKSFPDSSVSDSGETSLTARIRNGEVLFAIAELNELRAFQEYEGMFGQEAAFVGFPTPQGRGGHILFMDDAYAIAKVSEHKEGAWEFIEGFLAQEKSESYYRSQDNFFGISFPSLKKILNEKVEEAIETDSQYESGKFPETIYEDGSTFRYHALTWDEVNVMLELIPDAKPYFDAEGDEIIKIINEEASGYYSGQKQAEDVVSVIQNRVRLYLSEQ